MADCKDGPRFLKEFIWKTNVRSRARGRTDRCIRRSVTRSATTTPPFAQAIEIKINYRRGVEREDLAKRAVRRRSRCPADAALGAFAEPIASGSAPSSAAIVVIMIGRKRSKHA